MTQPGTCTDERLTEVDGVDVGDAAILMNDWLDQQEDCCVHLGHFRQVVKHRFKVADDEVDELLEYMEDEELAWRWEDSDKLEWISSYPRSPHSSSASASGYADGEHDDQDTIHSEECLASVDLGVE